MTVIELAEKTGVSRTWIYEMCKRLGRIPTVDEVVNRKTNGLMNKMGRPQKYRSIEDENGK